MLDRISIRSLLVLLIACPAAAHASSVPYEPEHVECHKASCATSQPDDKRAGYVFGDLEAEHGTTKKPEFDRDKHATRDKNKDKDYGPIEIPPRGKPEIVHTGSGTDIFPGKPTPTAVPVPAALWLLISGAAGLGLAARRHRRA